MSLNESQLGNLSSRRNFKVLPDDDGVDRITLDLTPRYKQSGLSGDEWRVSWCVQFWRKGQLAGEKWYNGIEAATAYLAAQVHSLHELGDSPLWGYDGSLCMQPGCNADATVTYRLKQEYSRQGEGPLPAGPWPHYRAFCEKHKVRGDCGLEDADDNYEPEAAR